MVVVIKDIPQEKWRVFKSEAARSGVKLGIFFGKMLDEYIKNKKSGDFSWNKILNDKPFLTEKEANVIRNASNELRKNFKMRI